MLPILKPFTLKWWQLEIYEISVLAVGIAIGAKWPHIFENIFTLLIAIFLIGGGYTVVTLVKQQKDSR